MLLSRQPRAEPSRLAWLSRIPIAVTSGRINRNLAHYYYLMELVGELNFTNTRQSSDSRAHKIQLFEFCFSWTSTFIILTQIWKDQITDVNNISPSKVDRKGLGNNWDLEGIWYSYIKVTYATNLYIISYLYKLKILLNNL